MGTCAGESTQMANGPASAEKETVLAQAVRAVTMLMLGFVCLAAFYGALIASAQVIALESGLTADERHDLSMWVTLWVLVLGAVPMVRFLADEVPLIIDRYIRSKHDYRGTLVLLVLAVLALLWL